MVAFEPGSVRKSNLRNFGALVFGRETGVGRGCIVPPSPAVRGQISPKAPGQVLAVSALLAGTVFFGSIRIYRLFGFPETLDSLLWVIQYKATHPMTSNLTLGPDKKHRCSWVQQTKDFIPYHDDEWGWPITDDRHLFEKLCLESFQSGLSWRTILSKRENFRSAFDNFDLHSVAKFDDDDRTRLLNNAGIIRHAGKINAVINNAARAQELVAEKGSLAAYVWSWEPSQDELGEPQTMTTCPSSVAMSKDMKKRGWKFVGPTTIFAFMQSMGLLNDHAKGCHMRDGVETARATLTRPR